MHAKTSASGIILRPLTRSAACVAGLMLLTVVSSGCTTLPE
jgi:hypothetical protein